MAFGPQAILGRMEQRWRFDVEAGCVQILAIGRQPFGTHFRFVGTSY